MGIAIRIDVLDPPFDAEAMHRLVRALPGVVERVAPIACYELTGDGSPTGEPPWFRIGADHVWVALRWSDNRYDHAAYLAHHVLDHHRCRGIEDDYGSALVDNDAIRAFLATWKLTPVRSPAARRAAAVRYLAGRHANGLQLAIDRITLALQSNGGEDPPVALEAELDGCEVRGSAGGADLEPDERTVIGLYRLLYCAIEPRWQDDVELVLIVDELALHLTGEWTATDPAGDVVIRVGPGGALWVDPALIE